MARGVNLWEKELWDPRPFRGAWQLGDPNILRDLHSDETGEMPDSSDAGSRQAQQGGQTSSNRSGRGCPTPPGEVRDSHCPRGRDEVAPSDQELQRLIDEYCEPHLSWVEWESAPGILRRDYLSLRGEALRGGRWEARFARALAQCAGDASGCVVKLPMERRRPPGPYGSGSWFWAEDDRAVFGMLHDCGASFEAPWMLDERTRVQARNEAAVEFFLFCPPGVAEAVLADHGLTVSDLDFSGSDVVRLLKVSGNADAFRWIREQRPQALDWGEFRLEELCETPLLAPLLELLPADSVSDDRLVDAATARACELLRKGQTREAEQLLAPLKLRLAHVEALLAAVAHAEGVPARQLRARLGTRRDAMWAAREDDPAEELVAFARWGEIDALERFIADTGATVSQASCGLWDACVKRLDAALLRFLLAHGLHLSAVVSNRGLPDESNALVRDVANACDLGGFESSRAREFLVEALEAGVRLEGNGAREAMQVLCLFPDDGMLYDRLEVAGFSFCSLADGDGDDGGVARLVNYLMGNLGRRITAAPAYSTMFERKEPDWNGLASVLNRGMTVWVDDDRMSAAREAFVRDPARFAALAAATPPGALQPAASVIDMASKAGDAAVLDLLRSWRSALDGAYARELASACAQRGMVEATALLMEIVDGAASSGWQDLEL